MGQIAERLARLQIDQTERLAKGASICDVEIVNEFYDSLPTSLSAKSIHIVRKIYTVCKFEAYHDPLSSVRASFMDAHKGRIFM